MLKLLARPLTLGAAAFVVSLSADASAARPQRSTTSGDFAQVFASRDLPITCADGFPGTLSTTISVSGFENVVRDGGRPSGSRTLDVSLFEFDTCVFSFRSSTGFLDNASFDASNRVATASGTVHLFEQTNNSEYRGKAVLNVTWSATETPAKTSHYSRDTFGSVTIINKSTGQFAQASVSGAVDFSAVTGFTANQQPIFAAPVNLLGGASVSANIGQNTNGNVTFIKHERTDATL
jgi:hypothetical protein